MTETFTVRSGGPAFIAAPRHCALNNVTRDIGIVRRLYGVPDDYVWQSATDCTMAGWVRRKNPAIPEADREVNSGSQVKRTKE